MEIIDLEKKEIWKEERGFAHLIDEPYLQVNQICLESGQHVPAHNADSNVSLLPLRGEGVLTVGNDSAKLELGRIFRVSFRSPMRIENTSGARLVFLVIKASHPSRMK